MTLTRRDLRRKVAGDLRDQMTVTAHEGSSNNLIIDPVELSHFDNTLVSSQLLCVSSASPANVGHIARVTGSDQRAKSISFDPPTPEPVSAGDEFDLVNLRGAGFRLQDYTFQIDSYVRQEAHRYPRKAISEPILFDAAEPYLEIPEDWIGVFEVTLIVDGQMGTVKASRSNGARGWWADPTNRVVSIGGSDAGICHGNYVVLHGLTPHPLLETDDDPCFMDGEHLALTAMSKLAARRGGNEWAQWSIEWARNAAGIRPAKMFRYPANTVMLERL